MEIPGDYDNIVEYFSKLLALQRRRKFPVHEYSFEFKSMEVIEDLDSGSLKENTEFPEKGFVDRVMGLNFIVQKGNDSFGIKITREKFSFLDINTPNFNYNGFISLIDDSTFRFF